jgi:tripartite-type tricarboxylate transporter receptor subunit TctC
MRPFLARFSEPVWSGHLPSWADFITTTPVFRFSVHTPGAGGMTGTSRAAKAPPDGYVFVLGNVATHAMNGTLYKNPLYNAAADFAPVALIAETPQVLVTRAGLPVNNLQEFMQYAKANQTKMQYASAGAGSATHLACALLNAAIGINVTHSPYRGGALPMQDLIAGRTDYMCPNAPLVIPQVDANQVRAIAILSKNRSAIWPALASAQEQGLDGFEYNNWNAFFLPRGAPPGDHPEASRCNGRSNGNAVSATTAEGYWRRSGAVRAQVARISSEIRGERDREMGGGN